MFTDKINVSFTGSSYKGQEQFKKLSETEKAVKLAVAKFTQKFNETNIGFKLNYPDNDLHKYINYRVNIEKICLNALKKFKG